MNAVKPGLGYGLLSPRRRAGSLPLPHTRGVGQPLTAAGPDKPIVVECAGSPIQDGRVAGLGAATSPY